MKCILKSGYLGFPLFMLFLFISSCKTDYAFQAFSYPPGSEPHKNNWEYASLVIFSSKNPLYVFSKKTVRVKIFDKKKKTLLNEKFFLKSTSVVAEVVWEKFEVFQVTIFEESDRDRRLKLLECTFLFDEEKNKFFKK